MRIAVCSEGSNPRNTFTDRWTQIASQIKLKKNMPHLRSVENGAFRLVTPKITIKILELPGPIYI